MRYAYAKLGGYDLIGMRLFGEGLGNMLFPWARFVVQTRAFRLTPITPTWPQLKLGPWLRHERDKRLYCGLFEPRQEEVRGSKKLRLLTFVRRADESSLRSDVPKNGDRIVVFEGVNGYFAGIAEEHDFVWEQLLRITRAQHQTALTFSFAGSISVHVRLGDFRQAKSADDLVYGRGNMRLPLTWYRHVIERIREHLGRLAPVFVFSDDHDAELRPLLQMPDTRRLSFGSSIGDLIALSRANVLVASNSTFSMWASYLGRPPAIWHKGLLRQGFYGISTTNNRGVECGEFDEIPDGFWRHLPRAPG